MDTMRPLFNDEDKARQFVESKRWPNGPVCPHCGGVDIATLTARPDSKRPGRPGLYNCRSCREQFTVRVGTVMEDSKVEIRKWLMAMHLMTSSKKGISSHQVAREVGVTQKTAWFLCHRIREAMRKDSRSSLLDGTVEVDETYVGGKPRVPGTSKRGRGTSKAPVLALVQRDGCVRSMPIDSIDSKTLHGEVRKHVESKATIITDELSSYHGIGRHFAGGHHSVNHGKKEYVRINDQGLPIHTNTAESYFALLKRAHYGIHHHFSRQHLSRYCDERSFMWDGRKLTDGERMVAAIRGIEGKRLMYG